MPSHLEIVRLLADGELHSGESLAEQLAISRAAVWKAVRKAAATLGVEVEAVRARGYRLTVPLELLERERILAGIGADTRAALGPLDVLDEVDSTNRHLMALARAGAPCGTLCIAERQTAGRGRHGRTWVSPFGSNIYLSLLWRFEQAPSELGGLSLAAGAGIAAVLECIGVSEVALKWPNDVLWRARKLAGLLLEVTGEAQGPSTVVIGVGVNTHLPDKHAQSIDQPWVDLVTARGTPYSRNRLVSQVIEHLVAVAQGYAAHGFEPYRATWERFDRHLGEPVRLSLGLRQWTGKHAGIAPDGALRLDCDGSILTFQAGEVSLRAGETIR